MLNTQKLDYLCFISKVYRYTKNTIYQYIRMFNDLQLYLMINRKTQQPRA
jgi:hypothetical protein